MTPLDIGSLLERIDNLQKENKKLQDESKETELNIIFKDLGNLHDQYFHEQGRKHAERITEVGHFLAKYAKDNKKIQESHIKFLH